MVMRLIVLPQALRVITPLTTSSYLDLTKDSSLDDESLAPQMRETKKPSSLSATGGKIHVSPKEIRRRIFVNL